MYSNVHTTQFGGGEIRGQFAPQTAAADFNGDASTDFAILRNNQPAVGQTQFWIQNNGSSSNSQVIAWGLSSDVVAPGDYDGDRKQDVAIFRQGASPGFWIFQSSNSTARFVRFGTAGDRPVVADYDGDGKDDPAIFREAAAAGGQSQFWWLASRGSLANQQIPVNWGTRGDTPLLGDFTGDGRADFAVQRVVGTGGVFYVHTSSGGADANTTNTITQFGLGTDYPVSGDYDGDGITDIAVVRLENGVMNWFVRPSSGGGTYFGVTWGASTDKPVQGDYDGDSKTDIAIWRPGNPSNFFVRKSFGGTLVQPYGTSADVPINLGSLASGVFRPEEPETEQPQ